MTQHQRIQGVAAPLPLANLDTDQIMPKQFLRGVDKSGLDKGLLYDMRFDAQGTVRPDFVLNKPGFQNTRILVAGPNFGCGSSREHAVWGLLQFGIHAIIAPSYGEIFYSNAMNNRLLLVTLPQAEVHAFLEQLSESDPVSLSIDLKEMQVQGAGHAAHFQLAERHREMFLLGQDMIGATLVHQAAINQFCDAHWNEQPWLRNVARITRDRLTA